MKGGGWIFNLVCSKNAIFFFSKGKNNNSAKIVATTFTGANKLGIVSNRSSNQNLDGQGGKKKPQMGIQIQGEKKSRNHNYN